MTKKEYLIKELERLRKQQGEFLRALYWSDPGPEVQTDELGPAEV